MSQGIRLLWDFYGPDAEKTAKHHHKHLADFLARNGLGLASGTLRVTEAHFAAYIDTPDRPAALDPEADAGEPERISDRIGKALRPIRFEELADE